MAALVSYRARGGTSIIYTPNNDESSTNYSWRPQLLFSHLQIRYLRPSIVTVRLVPAISGLETGVTKPQSQVSNVKKLAGSRDQAFRFLRAVVAQHSQSPKTELSLPSQDQRRKSEPNTDRLETEQVMPTVDHFRSHQRAVGSVPSSLPRPALSDWSRTDSTHSNPTNKSISSNTAGAFSEDKPLAAGNGVSVSVHLAEPVLFLQGFDQHDNATRSTVMLRGSLHLKVQKLAKIKAVSLKFKGTATTRWPEGIPPRKTEFEETDTLMSHTWPFFNAQFPSAESDTSADHVRLTGGSDHGSPYMTGSPANSSVNVHLRDQKRMSLSAVQALEKPDSKTAASVAQRGYRTFYPGDYIYNFELPLDSRLPESINVDLGFVKYELEASVERAGAFRANLFGTKEVTMIRAPTEGSLEQVEPIAISRTWEDQLHYDIVISGKSFPLGSKIPIAFKLTPLAKVQCHRVKVFITENTEYFCSHKRVHRMEPTKKVLLFEKRADGTSTSTFPGSTQRVTAGGGIPYNQRDAAARGEMVTPQDTSNLLGHLESDANIGPTEMEFSVQMPGCQHQQERERPNALHFDTTYQNIQVHHWIKIVLRLSRPDAADPQKRRHFEISIDSPFHILSCRANQANIALPAYSSPDQGVDTSQSLPDCGCPGAPRHRMSPNSLPTINALNEARTTGDRSDSPEGSPPSEGSSESSLTLEGLTRPALARPPTAHVGDHPGTGPKPVQRPIHMLRAPSFNPPSFDEEEPPPPLVTPPPKYNDIASPTAGHGLADYFSRWSSTYEAEAENNSDEEEDVDDNRSNTRGRVNLPLTPGGRVNRSMDLRRSDWEGLNLSR